MAENAKVAFVDAPVLGTKAPSEQGQLIVLASGPDSDGRSRRSPACELRPRKSGPRRGRFA